MARKRSAAGDQLDDGRMGERDNSAGGNGEREPGTRNWTELGRLRAANELCDDSDAATAASGAAECVCGADDE